MKKLAIAASVAAVLSMPAKADMLLGLYIGGQGWNSTSSGQLGEGSNQLDFGLEDKVQGSYFVNFEHPIPLVPNLRVAHTSLATEGTSTVEASFDLWEQTFDVAGEATTNFDVTYNDYTLYYELFDNGLFTFDFGATVRQMDADISIATSAADVTTDAGIEFTGFIPMGYIHTNIGIPATGFNFYGTGNLLSVGDHSLYDYEVGVSYEIIDNLAIDINLTAGYREVALELDNLEELTSDLKFKGVFAGAVVHF